jgi:hypothetical protein
MDTAKKEGGLFKGRPSKIAMSSLLLRHCVLRTHRCGNITACVLLPHEASLLREAQAG